MKIGDVVWARVTVERRPEGGTSWQVGGWARDDQMVPDGPLMRWLSGEDALPDDELVERLTGAMNPDGVWLSPDERPIMARSVLAALKAEAGHDAPG